MKKNKYGNYEPVDIGVSVDPRATPWFITEKVAADRIKQIRVRDSLIRKLSILCTVLVCIIAMLMLMLWAMTTRAHATECQVRPESGSYWSWRRIDGRRCWFQGHRVIPKSRLHWKSDPLPTHAEKDLPAPPEEKPVVMDADKGDRANDPPTRRGTVPTIPKGARAEVPKTTVIAPLDSREPLKFKDQTGDYCCWPDIKEMFLERWRAILEGMTSP